MSPLRYSDVDLLCVTVHDLRALRSQQYKFATLFRHMADSLFILDQNAIIREVNDAAAETLGYARSELVGEAVESFLCEACRGGLSGVATQLMEGDDLSLETTQVSRDGTEIVSDLKITKMLLEGSPAMLVAARDITERRKAEEHTAFQARLLQAVGQAVVATDSNGIITYWNRGAEHLYGWRAEEVLGRAITDTTPSSSSREEGIEIMNALMRGETYAGEFYVQHRDGRVFPIYIVDTPVMNEDGVLTGVIGVSSDITRQKRAENRLRVHERRYRRLFEDDMSAQVIALPDGRILECNPAFAATFAAGSPERAREQSIDAFFPAAADRDAILEEIQREGRIEHREQELVRADGTHINTLLNAVGTRSSLNKLIEVHFYIIDVTETKRLEERLRLSQRMEAIGRLASGVAHDFNNLLMVMQGFTDIMLSRRGAEDPERTYLDEIRTATSRAADLAHQLLAFGRQQDLAPVNLDLNRVIRDSEKMMQRMLPETIELHTVLEEGGCPVHADANQLGQILLNLAANARDAMPEGGILTYETACVMLSEASARARNLESGGAYVCLTVSDTGTGIDDETRSKIFEPFFTTKEVGSGTGLGLATVYGIVRQSEGSITCHSELGTGTQFEICLPLRDEVDLNAGGDSEAEYESDTGALSGRTVLVVEDEELVRNVATRTLEGEGATVLIAGNGREAIDELEKGEHGIHLVLSDLVMPNEGGIEVAQAIARTDPGIALVLMTGYNERGTEVLENLGLSWELIEKPIRPRALLEAVRRGLDADRPDTSSQRAGEGGGYG
jgi:PAS domain S-box-containing protein